MTKHRSARRRKLDSLIQLLRRHNNEEVRHYLCCAQYPRTLRYAALMVLRERSLT